MSAHFCYSEAYVQVLANDDNRRYLVSIGLPVHTVLFRAMEVEGPGSTLNLQGRDLLKVGQSDDDLASYYVDCATGAVVYAHTGTVFHVNASPRLFTDTLSTFEAGIRGLDDSTLETGTQRLASEIRKIDPTALTEDPGFWNSILFDVANGDYLDDDE